ncbi:hypothetical protein TREES_T100013332 [Tupaia chinensis]|uniref:Uncharacterized protein n=1 Tax=Tupaia chinensis TaxID=246437 RepID=L9KHN5_TUPCH|nr:hypothetical protein TREES_T100013332 [Tupaia chinensis]
MLRIRSKCLPWASSPGAPGGTPELQVPWALSRYTCPEAEGCRRGRAMGTAGHLRLAAQLCPPSMCCGLWHSGPLHSCTCPVCAVVCGTEPRPHHSCLPSAICKQASPSPSVRGRDQQLLCPQLGLLPAVLTQGYGASTWYIA